MRLTRLFDIRLPRQCKLPARSSPPVVDSALPATDYEIDLSREVFGPRSTARFDQIAAFPMSEAITAEVHESREGHVPDLQGTHPATAARRLLTLGQSDARGSAEWEGASSSARLGAATQTSPVEIAPWATTFERVSCGAVGRPLKMERLTCHPIAAGVNPRIERSAWRRPFGSPPRFRPGLSEFGRAR
jgi:hypothetical protein